MLYNTIYYYTNIVFCFLESLTDANVKVSFHPYDPSVAQTVAFMTSITGLSKVTGKITNYKEYLRLFCFLVWSVQTQ